MMSIKKTEWFTEELWKQYNSCCPKKAKIVSYKTYIKPWITDDIKSLINQKHAHFKNYKRGIIPYETYNQFNNNVTKLVKRAKRNFYFRKFDPSHNCIKKNWKIINSIFNIRKKKTKRSNNPC